jgi:alpha-D-ribose 1-methylphosphonate 5-triphosphate synthase subunit PhnI
MQSENYINIDHLPGYELSLESPFRVRKVGAIKNLNIIIRNNRAAVYINRKYEYLDNIVARSIIGSGENDKVKLKNGVDKINFTLEDIIVSEKPVKSNRDESDGSEESEQIPRNPFEFDLKRDNACDANIDVRDDKTHIQT